MKSINWSSLHAQSILMRSPPASKRERNWEVKLHSVRLSEVWSELLFKHCVAIHIGCPGCHCVDLKLLLNRCNSLDCALRMAYCRGWCKDTKWMLCVKWIDECSTSSVSLKHCLIRLLTKGEERRWSIADTVQWSKCWWFQAMHCAQIFAGLSTWTRRFFQIGVELSFSLAC